MIKKLKKFCLIFIPLAFLAFVVFNPFEARAEQVANDLLVEYLFPVGNLGDAIGVKVFNNPTRLSPLTWYQKNVPNPGTPTYLTVDGYFAVREGRTVYVGATEVKNSDSTPEIFARIYLISYNDKAKGETVNIYNQLLANWTFNNNIENKSVKDQLRRDLLRFNDFNQMVSALESYYGTHGEYPLLTSGTYIKGVTNSKWPSWQNVLGQIIGQSLPIDPINKFNTEIGPCAGCPNDSQKLNYQCNGTCYNPNNFVFEVPAGSHVYQYYTPEDANYAGAYYILTANFEYGSEAVVWKGDPEVVIKQGDDADSYNYLRTNLEDYECGNDQLEYGEVCDKNKETRAHSTCNAACLGWVCHDNWGNCDFNWNNGCEVELSSNLNNCGACGVICNEIVPANAEMACASGKCTWYCDEDGGYRYDPANDACELDHCVSPEANVGDTLTQPCVLAGGIGKQLKTCSNTHPPTWSSWGECTLLSCNEGYRMYNGTCELDHCISPEGNIGKINTQSCAIINGVGQQNQTCLDIHPPTWSSWGECAIASCHENEGYYDCDKWAGNGCETDVKTTVDNCGACGQVCAAPSHANATCSAGVCGYTCQAGYGDCNANKTDGCEVELSSNLNNCGACGQVCAAPSHANATCSAGVCGYTCQAGYGDCNANKTDGCEVELSSNLNNCGACGKICNNVPPANAVIACNAGTCGFKCNLGYREWNNACELNSCVSPEGEVGDQDTRSCRVTHGTGQQIRTCQNFHPPAWGEWGECGNVQCEDHWGNCDGLASNGCETNLLTDVNNCQQCGSKCPIPPNTTPKCSAGICGWNCVSDNYKDCDENAINGCESNLLTDINNCGACGKICNNVPPLHASKVCSDGKCGWQCNEGYDKKGNECVLAAPSNLSVSAISDSQINLAWTDNAKNENGFKIERKKSNTSWQLVVILLTNSVSYADVGLNSATTYYYRVKAYNQEGESDYSNEDSATTEVHRECTEDGDCSGIRYCVNYLCVSWWCRYWGVTCPDALNR